jgi:hypothetical protein
LEPQGDDDESDDEAEEEEEIKSPEVQRSERIKAGVDKPINMQLQLLNCDKASIIAKIGTRR